MTPADTATSQAKPGKRNGPRGQLTSREREMVELLAEGLSGTEIADRLYLSPETVRTHIRNAMGKLGASTRPQAVALALQRREIPGAGAVSSGRDAGPARPASAGRAARRAANGEVDQALEDMLASLCSLYDMSGGLVLLVDEDGLTLRPVATASSNGDLPFEVPELVVLGRGPMGKVALNRRPALLPSLVSPSAGAGTAMAAPILAGGHLLGVLGLTSRSSRPVGQSELLVLQALVARIGEILQSGDDVARRLRSTAERFRASWATTA